MDGATSYPPRNLVKRGGMGLDRTTSVRGRTSEHDEPWGTERAWRQLRVIIADEYVGKLPSELGMRELAAILGVRVFELVDMVHRGAVISVSPRGTPTAELRFRPRDNRALFMRETLLHVAPPCQTAFR